MLFAALIGGLLGLFGAMWAYKLMGHSDGTVLLALFVGWPCISAYFGIMIAKDLLRSLKGK